MITSVTVYLDKLARTVHLVILIKILEDSKREELIGWKERKKLVEFFYDLCLLMDRDSNNHNQN